jgi:hypothetical protein
MRLQRILVRLLAGNGPRGFDARTMSILHMPSMERMRTLQRLSTGSTHCSRCSDHSATDMRAVLGYFVLQVELFHRSRTEAAGTRLGYRER